MNAAVKDVHQTSDAAVLRRFSSARNSFAANPDRTESARSSLDKIVTDAHRMNLEKWQQSNSIFPDGKGSPPRLPQQQYILGDNRSIASGSSGGGAKDSSTPPSKSRRDSVSNRFQILEQSVTMTASNESMLAANDLEDDAYRGLHGGKSPAAARTVQEQVWGRGCSGTIEFENKNRAKFFRLDQNAPHGDRLSKVLRHALRPAILHLWLFFLDTRGMI